METGAFAVNARPTRCVRSPLGASLRPEEALLWLRGDRRPFALVGDWLGVRAVLGSEPLHVAEPGDDPWSLLETLPPAETGDEALVGGGWVGWLGYGLGARIERLPPPPPAPAPRPPFSLAFHDHVVLHDGERWWFEALWTPERAGFLSTRLELWRRRLRSPPPPSADSPPRRFRLSANGARGHLSAIQECARRIAAGELYQANLCLRLETAFAGDPLDLFARALPRARPRFGACLDGTVSLSPERFLRRAGRRVWTEPIKGTRPRLGRAEADATAREALLGSAKDAAEHVMIVDLMRNDLGRVCEYGTVTAEAARVEGHAGVWHLVSTVAGRLRPGTGDGDLLRATFPPGSVTGAPKVQAMKVISELEATRRELYTGAVGIVSPRAGLDLSVAIRTFETTGGRIWIGAGGGIVADSDPRLELAEALAKARGPLAAIGAGSPPVAREARPKGTQLPHALEHGRRPDPGSGVFETVLVLDGEPVQLEEHLERLRASLRRLYEVDLAGDTMARVAAAVARGGRGRRRLRIIAGPGDQVEIETLPEGATAQPAAALAPYLLPGGLGAHKWHDRALLDALTAHRPGTVPLLVDTDGHVLEAAYANVWIVEDGGLLTPAADGRILPGVTRRRLLRETPGARETELTLARLARAREIFLTSSIGGRRRAELASTV